MFHKFYSANTKPPLERPNEIVGFLWSSQVGTCYMGRMYDGSKFRFRNWAKAMKLKHGKGKRRNRVEKVASYRKIARMVQDALGLPGSTQYKEAIKKLTGTEG